MKRSIFILLPAFIFVSLISCGEQEQPSKAADLTAKAKEFVNLLVNGNYTNAVTNFDNTMKGAMPSEKLQEAWNSLLAKTGPFKKYTGVRQVKEQGYDVVYVTCEFEKAKVDIKVVYNDAKQVSGLWFRPAQ
jgi:hypothetical protein